MTYIYSLIGTVTLLLAMLATQSVNQAAQNLHKSNLEKTAVVAVSETVVAFMRQSAYFQRMISQNGTCNVSFACIRDGTDCITTLGGLGGVTASQTVNCLYNFTPPYNGVAYDETLSNNGFDIKGRPCGTYSEQTPDSTCIFKPQVRWRPLCAGAPCIGAPVEITVAIKISSNSSYKLSSEKRRYREVIY
jgi:hypothetical protein